MALAKEERNEEIFQLWLACQTQGLRLMFI